MKLLNPAFTASVMLVIGCATPPADRTAPSSSSSTIRFADHAVTSGLDFVHVNGMTGQHDEAEIYPPGVALFDADNDGDLDVYVVQGALPRTPASGTATARDRLFRNDLAGGPGGRTLRFTDVTASSGIALARYGMGVAAGDYNNDGWVDLFTTRLGGNVLLENNRDGTFTDVTSRAHLGESGQWSTSAAFVDIDRDGWLDLFVTDYLEYTPGADIRCFAASGAPDYCDPSVYRPARGRLFHNDRNGTFSNITRRALVGPSHGASLGVSTADFNGDGWLDIYVANDRQENDLWINRRDGTFSNDALAAGVALNADGRAEASMGVDAGDFDNDGDEDLFITNFTSEGHTLYVNRGDGTFEDAGRSSRLRPASLPYTGFGTGWVDADNDGRLDLVTVNGAVRTIEALAAAGDPFPLHQRKQAFRNRGDGTFDDVTAAAGSSMQGSDVGRGAAFGDVDNDGDIDLLVGNNNGPVQLLLNESSPPGHWIGVRVVGDRTRPRDMVGARVGVTQGAVTTWRRARADGSYASANDPRVIVGLGSNANAAGVVVQWPDGHEERWSGLATNTWHTLREGTAP